MVNEKVVEKLMKPIVDRQEAINNYVIEKIAKRVREIGELSSSDVYSLTRLRASGADIKEINEELARLTGLQVKDIKKLIKQVAELNYIDAKPFYDYRHTPYIPFEKNIPLQEIVAAVAKQTVDTYINLSKSQAFMIRDLKNPKVLKPTSIAKTYQSIVDEAIQVSQQGTIDYNTAMRRTMKQLNESGIRYVTYDTESGRKYTQRLDTAVRRNILDGIRAINQGVQDEVGKQFGADGKEITVHENSAPDHEPIQGHQFTNEEYDKLQNEEPFEDYNGRKFSAIKRAIGTLNCRHFTYSIVLGVTKPNYSQEQLDEMIKRNHQGYTTKDGRHLTLYECTQYQRRLETEIRKNKDGQMMALQCGDEDLAREYQAKINRLTKKYNAFSKAVGIAPQKTRMTVSGYHKISVKG